jgi:hypothetical protein
MNDDVITPVWYYNTTWDNYGLGKINVKYVIK